MTIRNDKHARLPGPLGQLPGVGGRVPGPLGFQVVLMAPGPVVAANQILTTMPPPTNDHDSRDVHEVKWPLFSGSDKSPVYTQVKQAPSIANCPVASVLAALAFTSFGRGFIQNMLSEKAGNVVTDLSGIPKGGLSNPPKGNTITSSRYFTVKLPGGSVIVSDILYTDDHDAGWSPFYMHDPRDQVIWAAIIEKALAVQLGSYENFDALNLTANDFWEKITGSKPGGIEIKADTPLATIIDAAKASVRTPTIGASKPDGNDVKFVSQFHGFAMIGVEGGKIKLYDPAEAKVILLAPADFRHDFQAILFRK